MYINPVDQSFTSYRIEVSKEYSKHLRKQIKTNPILEVVAEKNDVFLKFIPSQNLGNTILQIFKRGIDHIADIPAYALKHNTGDQVYINWEEKIAELEIPCNQKSIEKKIRNLFGIID